MRAGRLAPAEDLAQRALEIKVGLDLGNTEAAARWAMAKVYAHRGRADEAREHANRSIAFSRGSGDKGWLSLAMAVLGFLELSCGDAEAAVEILGSVSRPDAARDPEIVGALPDLIEALTLTGDLDRAAARQRRLESFGSAGRAVPGLPGRRCAAVDCSRQRPVNTRPRSRPSARRWPCGISTRGRSSARAVCWPWGSRSGVESGAARPVPRSKLRPRCSASSE